MNAFTAFFKKELSEAAHTHKLTVMGLVFLLFGMMNPLTAKVLPDILAGVMPDGITITLATPTALDSWAQFFKNVPQMGLIVMVLLYGGMLANELSRGTLTQLLTRGLPRKTVVLAKFSAASLVWTAAYALCFFVTYAYTVYFWPEGSTTGLPLAAFSLWVFGLMLLSTLLLGGVLFKNSYGCLLLTGGLVALLSLLNILPAMQAVNPMVLPSNGMALLSGTFPASGFVTPLLVTGAIIMSMLSGTIFLFNRKAL
ncbi:MAG: ABC transporter permease subunit [Eubacteriales bacterium]|nr:ABC transporter permease subunit [Eubacteriales bacterium]